MSNKYIEEKIKEFDQVLGSDIEFNTEILLGVMHDEEISETALEISPKKVRKWLREALTQTHNNALMVAVESLPRGNEGDIGHECQCGNPIICNYRNNYRDEAITNINNKKV